MTERDAPGPLVDSEANPRYFTVASGDGTAVYLTGSHIWNNFHGGMGPGSGVVPEARMMRGGNQEEVPEWPEWQ
jgi:hypothetical protein